MSSRKKVADLPLFQVVPKPCAECGEYPVSYSLSEAWHENLETLISRHGCEERLAACETVLDAWHLYLLMLRLEA